MQREQVEQPADGRKVRVAEACVALGRDRQGVVVDARTAHRHCDVFRKPLVGEFLHDREFRLRGRIAGLSPDRLAELLHAIQSALAVGLAEVRGCRDLDLIAKTVIDQPVPGEAEQLRVQRADMCAGAVDRQAGGHHAPGEGFEQQQHLAFACRLMQQPVLDVRDRAGGGRSRSAARRTAHQRHRAGILPGSGVQLFGNSCHIRTHENGAAGLMLCLPRHFAMRP
jgi:hypothetical protein